jgi:hypothetical protein
MPCSLSDVAEKAEGSLMLYSINELREHQPHSPGGGANVAMVTAPIYHTLALLHTVIGEYDKVRVYSAILPKFNTTSLLP